MALEKAKGSSLRSESIIAPHTTHKQVAMDFDPAGIQFMIDRLIELYHNPIYSTVRELISNAQDALMKQPEALRQPLKITLPTKSFPYFVVEDFAQGMTPEVVEYNFLKFGGSLGKRDDFSQIGAYGLGAKAPLAYCSEFLVTSTAGGVTTEARPLRDATGSNASLTITPTGLPSGTKITVPVAPEDFASFSKALASYRSYSYDVPLDIQGEGLTTFSDDLIPLTSLPLTEDEEGPRGQLWLSREAFKKQANIGNFAQLPLYYLLSGWVYGDAVDELRHGSPARMEVPSLLLQVLPGVLDYSSSRDTIVQNKRLEALNKQVASFLDPDTQAMRDSLMEAYRSLSLPEALAFLQNTGVSLEALGTQGSHKLVAKIPYGAAPDSLYYSRSRNKSFTRPLEDFILHEGHNPLEVNEEGGYARNVFAVVNFSGSNSRSQEVIFTSLRGPEARTNTWAGLYGLAKDTDKSESLSVAFASLEEAFKNAQEDASLVKFAYAYYCDAYKRSAVDSLRFLVLEQVPAGLVQAVKTSRKHVKALTEAYAQVVFLRTALTEEEKALLGSLGLGYDVKAGSAFLSEVLALKAEASASTRKDRPLRDKTVYQGYCLSGTVPGSTEDELFSLESPVQEEPVAASTLEEVLSTFLTRPKVALNMEAVLAQDSTVLVLSQGSLRVQGLNSCLWALANEDYDLGEKPLVVFQEEDLNAQALKKLATHTKVYLNAPLKRKSQAASSINAREGIIRHAKRLNKLVENVSQEELLSSLMANLGGNNKNNRRRLEKVLTLALAQDEEAQGPLGSVFSLALRGLNTSSENYHPDYMEVLELKVTPEEFKEYRVLASTLKLFLKYQGYGMPPFTSLQYDFMNRFGYSEEKFTLNNGEKRLGMSWEDVASLEAAYEEALLPLAALALVKYKDGVRKKLSEQAWSSKDPLEEA